MSETMNQTEQLQAYTMTDAHNIIEGVTNQVNRVMEIDKEDMNTVIASMLVYGGHLLLEGPAGTGKTLLAKSVADSIGGTSSRIQFNPETRKSSIIGKTVYRQNTQEFDFLKGPIFANFVLGDEVNRADEEAQAFLLEAMAESQVTEDGVTYKLPAISMVMATQNPYEVAEGTHRLTSAQTDRFMASIGFAAYDAAMDMKVMNKEDEGKTISKVATPEQIVLARAFTQEVTFGAEDKQRTVDLIDAVRNHPAVNLRDSSFGGARASLATRKLARAHAVIRENLGVDTKDIDTAFTSAARHRITVTNQEKRNGTTAEEVIDSVLQDL